MSVLLYLALLNIGFGFSVALWLGLRNRYVRRHLQLGYDLHKLTPPSLTRSLWRRLGQNVNVSLVCQRLGAEPIPECSESPPDETSDQRVDSSELPVNEKADDEAQSRAFGPHLPDAESATQSLSEHTPSFREVRCLDPLAAKYGASETLGTNGATAKDSKVLESAATATMSNAKVLESQKLSADFQAPSHVESSVPKHSSTSSDAPHERSELGNTIEGDFLQHAAWIDQSLRTVLEQHDHVDESALREMAAQVAATHDWWTQFEGSISKVLDENVKQAASRDQRAQVDDDLIAMQACLVECQALLGEAGLGSEPAANKTLVNRNTARELPLKMRTRMMQAAKACHRLRDNLVLMLPESPLRFSETNGTRGDAEPNLHLMKTRPTSFVSDYGVRGLTEVVRQWRQEVQAGAARVAALILIDIDETGHWNDKLGLESMDAVLKVCHQQIAECLRSNRGYDRVVRASGQQFVVFLGATSTHAARFAAERIRQGFANTTWQAASQAFVLNISAAICDYQEATSIQAQITRLRQGLPEAKRVGGNAVVIETSPARFQQVTGIQKYNLPTRHHDQLSEKWKPKAEMTCAGS